MQIFSGIAVSPGIAEGKAFVIEKGEVNIPKYWLHDRELQGELQRFNHALSLSKQQIQRLKEKIGGKMSYSQGREHILILEGHLAMLDDVAFTERSRNIIATEKINAEWAVAKTLRQIMELFSKIDEEYFRERQNDIAYVMDRVQKNLLGKTDEGTIKTKQPVVVLAHDLSPADLAHLPRGQVIALATEAGGRTSHTGIIASAMGIPAVVGVENLLKHARNGDAVLINGIQGSVILNASTEMAREYRQRKKVYQTTQSHLLAERNLPQQTKDLKKISLTANLELLDEIPFIVKQGAKAIGLFRSEMLFLQSDRMPTEEEQVHYYSEILKKFSPHPVTMRTYDLGGDKLFGQTPSEREANPALGVRAIRYCLQEKKIFRTQLRAMFRASVHGKLRIMFPMICDMNEVYEAKKLTVKICDELRQKKIPFDPNVHIGIMIETPAAVVIADRLAKMVDFFSVGTNDLIQYTLAVDRVNEQVAHLFNPLHPAILRMLRRLTKTGEKYKIPVNLCGEMASDPLFLPVLVGLGFKELSLNAVSLPLVKHILRSLDAKDCSKILKKIFKSNNADASYHFLRKEMQKRFPEEFQEQEREK